MFRLVILSPNMRMYKKYFCYGSIITSLIWVMSIYLYTKMESLPPSFRDQPYSDNKHIKFRSKYTNSILPNEEFNQLYGHKETKKEQSQEDIIAVNNQRQDFKYSGHRLHKNLGSHIKYGSQIKYNNKVIQYSQPVRKIVDHDRDLRRKEKYKNEVLIGKGDDLIELGIVRNSDDQKIKDEGEALYAFNLLISDRLSFHRDIPDSRHKDCKNRTYPEVLPAASVIICFHNEAFSTLMRTVHSVVSRSPEKLLHEIVLIDDFSNLDHLKSELEEYISEKFTKVKLYRTDKREGLIRARILGAEKATGEVLVFLDSHCEVNKEWLQPLLFAIQEDPTTVSIPVIDIINQDTFSYEDSPLVRGGFNWGMHFRWDNIPQSWWRKHKSKADPLP